jgi:uncharacterized membrane protein
MSKDSDPRRIWEIDFLRGVAIILMVCYHRLFDLGEFVGIERFLGWSTDLTKTAWIVAQFFFAALFVVLSGISGTLSRNNVRRGLRLLAVSLLVSAATFIIDPAQTVYFGILQCLAVSMLLYGAAFQKAGPVACAAWGAAVIGLSAALPAARQALAVRSDWLMPFGITGPSFSSFDYFPLIPWLGVFLIGAALGKSVYVSKRSLLPWRLPQTFVNFAGRHSLLIYIVHQPVIMGVLYALGLAR